MGSAINLDEIKRFEVTEVYAHPDAKVDIVLIHGLNGDPRRTWTAKNGVFWPTELLPITLKSAKARILVYGYNADVYAFGGGRSPSSDMIHQHAQSFLSNLALERKSEEVSDHPIIFIAHSLGGILLKRALELSNDLTSKNADDNRSIFVSTYGIIFLGTPHNGADPAKWGLILQGMVKALAPKKAVETEAQLIKTLQTNNETLQNINLHFLDIYQRFKICMAHETDKTDLKTSKAYIVDQTSASPLLPDVIYFGIEATHSGMCKFESKNSPGYLNVSTTIKSWIQECLPIIQARWDMERRTRRQMREAQAAELLDIFSTTPNVSTNANTPDPPNSVNNSTIIVKPIASIEPDEEYQNTSFFIKPFGFRPNSLFVGRKAELAELHKLLFDSKRRADGTSAVLIQSMPGGGKTHLARQYVYEHKNDFPGGIFWLRAKSQTELAAGFWDIARKAAIKPFMVNQDDSCLRDPQQFIEIVRKWLNDRRDWLMVLDGIHFDDGDALRRFIPDSTNTSLIYTSTEKSVSGDYQWMNPQIIKLPLLSAREAQQLLLLELDRKEPFTKDDLKNSMELVQSMGLLPVVIHAVAQRLKATDEPLGKFARSYAAEPRLRGLGAYIAVVDQLKILGAYEALNLIYILCFFGQHIPVELISLGLKVLDVPFKTSEPVSGRSLNNTFRILNMFALIDRNEQESSLHSSQSSKSSRDMLADNVDVIRLHSVVQGFFADTLLANGTLHTWLDRAVRVFCCSYDIANDRITRKTNAGLVEDFRMYEIHGNRLRDHVAKYQRKSRSLEETMAILEGRLTAIRREIERRTPESSHFIANERPDAFQTSIFDRSSSSSDTGPETPGQGDKIRSVVSTWGLEPDKVPIQSPISFNYEDPRSTRHVESIPKSQFPPLPTPDDPGYESDRESLSMTLQPSQRTVRPPQGSPISPSGAWQVVKPRRPRTRPAHLDIRDHRTTRVLEKQRYRDSAGAFRAMSKQAIDPRLSHETAQGYLERTSSRDQSRGRISGQSSAEVALAHITKSSPPPARGGGMIQDRRSSSQRGNERGRLVAGTASYAAAVASPTRDTILGYRDTAQAATELPESSSESNFGLIAHSPSSAIASLQKFPIEAIKAPSTPQPHFIPLPPYPPSPNLSYQQPYPSSDTALYHRRESYSQENQTFDQDPYHSNRYPRMTGPVPFETLQNPPPSSLRKRDLPHGEKAWRSQTYSDSMPSSKYLPKQSPPGLSVSSPNIRTEGSYYPGHPEFSNTSHQDGYTSQPMSRDTSGQSAYSNHSSHLLNSGNNNRRRPSLAETEPPPDLPAFSPRIPPTSYQVYERMRETEREGGLKRKSPRLEFSRVGERLDEWTLLSNEDQNGSVPRRWVGPAAPPFPPSSSPFTHSPNLPSVPPNSMLSNPSNNTSSYPSPLPPSNTHYSPPPVPHATPQSFIEGDETFKAPEMGRSTSGGVKVGSRVIEFGDFPDPADFDLAENTYGGVPETLEGLGITELRR